MVHYPEYNSTLILRSEVLSEGTPDFPEQIPSFRDRQRMSHVHRKLLPRRPGRDSYLEQFCTLYGTVDGRISSIPGKKLWIHSSMCPRLLHFHSFRSFLLCLHGHECPTPFCQWMSISAEGMNDVNKLYQTILAIISTSNVRMH